MAKAFFNYSSDRKLEQFAVNKLIEMAYKKLMVILEPVSLAV